MSKYPSTLEIHLYYKLFERIVNITDIRFIEESIKIRKYKSYFR